MPSTGPTNANVFDPPTADQLERHLDANPPAMSAGWRAYLPQIALVAAAGMMVIALLQPALGLLAMLAMVGLVIYVTRQGRALQALSQRVTRAWELTLIRRYRDALGEAWRLLPDCRANPELHGRVVTVMAHILGELRRDDAAEVAYAYLLDRLPKDHPLSLRLRVQRAIAALHTDRLADADEALRRLRGQVEQAPDPALRGMYTLARLLQDVRTGHDADAADQAHDTAEALKALGVEAGYGYALLGLCHHRLAQRDAQAQAQAAETPEQAGDAPDNAGQAADTPHDYAAQARLWWDRATILIPPAALVFRFPELEALMDDDKNRNKMGSDPDKVSNTFSQANQDQPGGDA